MINVKYFESMEKVNQAFHQSMDRIINIQFMAGHPLGNYAVFYRQGY